MTLPTAKRWYTTKALDDRITLITEPHVHPIFSANMHLITGRNADLLIDSGMGVAPLRPVVDAARPDPTRPLICLTTHTHVDHVGAVAEFDIRLVHPIEAANLADPRPYTLDAADISDGAANLFLTAGYPPLWPWLIDARPDAAYDPRRYRLVGAPATGTVSDGEIIDLGDWKAEVVHLPGHSPGQIGLFHAASKTLFGADAIYNGPLIYDAPGMSVPDYAATLRRIAALDPHTIHGGHDPSFGPERCAQIIDHYLTLWQA